MKKTPIYLDTHATTPVDPRVLEAMLPYFSELYGNPSSKTHIFGKEAEAAVEQARQSVASLIKAEPEEIIFTSGATESDNMALKGVAEMYREKGNHIITVVTEHKAILETTRWLEKEGFAVTYLPVDQYGQVEVEDVVQAITPKTILISVMSANNEVGTLAPIDEIGKIARESGILFHTDAAQSAGKRPIEVQHIDLLSLSAHKFYGPKGVGALYVRSKNPRVRLVPIMHGGGQEKGLRSGTLNVSGIVGLGKACDCAKEEMKEDAKRIYRLREKLYKGITSQLEGVYLNGHPIERLDGSLNMSFAHIEGEALVKEIGDHVALSLGSACSAGRTEPSYVLTQMNVPVDLRYGAIRMSVGRFNTEEQIDTVIERIVQAVKKLRASSPLYQISQQNTK